MALEKQKKLRKIEFIFLDDQVNPECHCEYEVFILEDGNQISKTKHRENMKVADAKIMIQQAEVRAEVDNIL